MRRRLLHDALVDLLWMRDALVVSVDEGGEQVFASPLACEPLIPVHQKMLREVQESKGAIIAISV